MPPSFLFQQEIEGPFEISFETLCFVPKHLAAIEFSLRTNSTIPELSDQDLGDAAASFQNYSLELQTAIPDLERFLEVMKVQVNQLQTAEGIARDARMRLIQPFPPLPLDLAREIVSVAAGHNKSTAKCLSLVSKQLHQWSVHYNYPGSCHPLMFRYRARQQLWRSVFIDQKKLEGFLTLLRDHLRLDERSFDMPTSNLKYNPTVERKLGYYFHLPA
ncbi:hypothetical protein DL96DRAFT_1794313 [Flagelloscypha sp. PMI_526]|nr:hypothetical protein DL96DRAFT_1794313 [Flagelloscypha sp. PMI_526]